jgi:hypothetical protein
MRQARGQDWLITSGLACARPLLEFEHFSVNEKTTGHGPGHGPIGVNLITFSIKNVLAVGAYIFSTPTS